MSWITLLGRCSTNVKGARHVANIELGVIKNQILSLHFLLYLRDQRCIQFFLRLERFERFPFLALRLIAILLATAAVDRITDGARVSLAAKSEA